MSEEQLRQYQQGWLDGAAMKPYPKPIGNDKDYLKGHADGTKAWQQAMDQARETYGTPLISRLDSIPEKFCEPLEK